MTNVYSALALVVTAVLPVPVLAAAPLSDPTVGIVARPCDHVPAMPPLVAESLARMLQARAAGQPLPARSPESLAAYERWQAQLLALDFSNHCRYEAANQALPIASPGRIVFIGSSIIEGWGKGRPAFFSGDRVNRGISGQTTQQILGRFYADVIALRPAIVHILAGTNDIAGNTGPTSLNRVQNNIRAMVELAQAHNIRVILGTVTPARRFGWRPSIDPVQSIAALNDWIREYARTRGVALVDYHKALDDGRGGLAAGDSSDGVHPTSEGYRKMEAAFSAKVSM